MEREKFHGLVERVREHMYSPEVDLYSPDSGFAHVRAVKEGIERANSLVDRISDGDSSLLSSSCSWELRVAEDHFKASLSFIKIEGLKKEWEETVETQLSGVENRLSGVDSGSPEEENQRVVRPEEKRYHLVCSTCEAIACAFHSGYWHLRINEGERIIYRGFTRETTISPDYESEIYNMLEEEQIEDLHNLLSTPRTVTETLKSGEKRERRGFLMEEGLDTYCPECDRIYCHRHWETKEYWDEGFYDYTDGTCPEGHTRMLDD